MTAAAPDPTETGGRLDAACGHAATARLPQRACSAAMIGLESTALTDAEAILLRRLRPAGIFLFRRNIGSPAALCALTAAIRDAAGQGVLIAIDQEGGRVARLRPPDFLAHPPAAAISTPRAAWLTGALIGLEARATGFDMVSAPVLDLAVPGSDAVIGDRAYRGTPDRVAALGAAMAEGLGAAGVIAIGKHVPGHGRALADSHLHLPELDDVTEDDLAPFIANRALPALMTAHIRYRAVDPLHPATCSATVIERIIRRRIGFDGLLVSDDLGMQALSGTPAERAAAAIAAGCDLALDCSGRFDDSAATAIAAGEAGEATLSRIAAARAWVAARHRRDLAVAPLLAERSTLLAIPA
ncbi:beta-N-acetylhexosaminidase [Endobacter medicaginis]|uniref:beta-N-acetylhexosaminidase n=1 Tax=Endobacter medicaginis TaxID=1181271 RepID=A0A839USX1_9PROT|nr:beta-N-acetylhexosaminidase [Endobacter medicaginis]MBB3173358.1 beta-N-acetylhexosaminidase [Endobacter medicaginis]MCX5477284.1 beta-N-acetylhexosaminidase [Endobacter medicaginis]